MRGLAMRFTGLFVTAFVLLLPLAPAHTAEQGIVIRAGDLKAQPFLDAAMADRVAAKQQVTIIRRQGGWVQVQSNGKTGWLRMLNVRLATAAPAANTKSASLLRTGSSGKTVTTGVKGLGEEDIRKATPDPLQVAALDAMAVPPAEATANARQSGLRENQVAYLDKGSAK